MIPRCARSSSTSRKLREKREYSQTAWLIISGGNKNSSVAAPKLRSCAIYTCARHNKTICSNQARLAGVFHPLSTSLSFLATATACDRYATACLTAIFLLPVSLSPRFPKGKRGRNVLEIGLRLQSTKQRRERFSARFWKVSVRQCKDTESISKSSSMSSRLERSSGESKRRGTVAHASPKIPFLQGVCHFLQIVSEGTHLQVRCPPII